SSRQLGYSSSSSIFSAPRAKDGRPEMIPGMPGRWNGPQLRRHLSTTSLKSQRSKAVGPSGTLSTQATLTGNTNEIGAHSMNGAVATTYLESTTGRQTVAVGDETGLTASK